MKTLRQKIQSFKSANGIKTLRSKDRTAWAACLGEWPRSHAKTYNAAKSGRLVLHKTEAAAIRELCRLNEMECDL